MPSKKQLRDYYKILGVEPSASADEIRSAYRGLARKFHPDINKSEDSEFWMQLINEAYDVLGDKRKKALYDYVFFADRSFSSQEESEYTYEPAGVSVPQNGSFRNRFSHFIVSVVGIEEALNISLVAFIFVAVALYVVFGQAELAAGMIASLFVVGSLVLMIRIMAEIFSRAGIRQEESWFQEVFAAAGYLPQNTSRLESNATKVS
jgi:hypothetical protein